MKITTATCKSKALNKYMVHAEFTTYRGNSLTGRSADVCLETEGSIDDLWADIETIKQFCIGFILSQKPAYKIFMLGVKSISNENGL